MIKSQVIKRYQKLSQVTNRVGKIKDFGHKYGKGSGKWATPPPPLISLGVLPSGITHLSKTISIHNLFKLESLSPLPPLGSKWHTHLVPEVDRSCDSTIHCWFHMMPPETIKTTNMSLLTWHLSKLQLVSVEIKK